jgi:hypothetical protein
MYHSEEVFSNQISVYSISQHKFMDVSLLSRDSSDEDLFLLPDAVGGL